MKRAAALRGIVATFCWVTALYAFLASSSFAYQQFLRPRVFRTVGLFADWHSTIYWAWLLLAVGSIAGELRKKGVARALAASFVVVWSCCGVWLGRSALLPTLADNRRSVIVGLVALLPIVWLALIDHVVGWRAVVSRAGRQTPDSLASREARLLLASMGTALFVVVLYAALTPLALAGRFEPDLLTSGLMFGLAWNVLDHLLLFCAAFLVMALVERTVGWAAGFHLRYASVFGLAVVAFAGAVQRIFTEAIGIDAAWGAATSIALSLSLVGTWAGVRMRRWCREINAHEPQSDRSSELQSGFDVLFGPRNPDQTVATQLIWVAGVAGLAYGLAAIAGRLDWDFLLLKFGVIAVWVLVFDRFYRLAPRTARILPAVVFFVCAAPLVAAALEGTVEHRLPHWLGQPGWTVRHTLDRYLVYNPSFRLADGLVRDTSDDTPTFDRFLRSNTGIAVDVPPVDVDFVPALGPAPISPVPDVFLLVVDSLRPDYLAPYNADVTFTPRISEFARDSVVFRNAFTRYGGTGLSMPSMWMGAAVVHKQYVQPFRRMNALEKLLDANGYQRFISLDHIMAQLLTPSTRLNELDRGVPEMAYDFCGTVEELGRDVQRIDPSASPLFGHTRSLNLHVAAVRNGSVPAGESYPGFEAPYAARVHRIDRCFGEFIDSLKRRGIYDRSIVILTSDHGELLGEDGRWGHAYYLFPEVLQIPLLVHFPPSIVERASIDPSAISFSTDITPTLYAALGYRPARQTPLMGQTLIGASELDPIARRRGSEVVIASYGAVYGVLTRNGRRLYIIDGNHRAEYAYERRGSAWAAVAVSEPFRSASQRAIREYVDEIAIEYHLP